jgi:hypothetical protein
MTANLASLAVTTDKLADNAVNGAKIQAGSVGAAHIAPGAVGSAQIAFGAVGSAEIATDAVGSLEIATNAVGTDELRNNVSFGTTTTNGSVDVLSDISDRVVTSLATNVGGGGFVRVRSNDGQNAIVLSTIGGGVAGFLTVHDAAGAGIAGIDGSNGNVFGTTKSFVVPDPTNPHRLIRYTSLEGPEAGIYVRGVADLEAGEADVTFPEHFRSMVVPSSITVVLTPRSATSRGLAAVEVTAGGVQVQELSDGRGSYRFVYVAHGVRQGFEDYEVYSDRDATDLDPASVSPTPGADARDDHLRPLPSWSLADPWRGLPPPVTRGRSAVTMVR